MTSEWPVWPPGEEGILLSDLDVDMPINELFLLVHGGDFEFRVSHSHYVIVVDPQFFHHLFPHYVFLIHLSEKDRRTLQISELHHSGMASNSGRRPQQAPDTHTTRQHRPPRCRFPRTQKLLSTLRHGHVSNHRNSPTNRV